MINKKMKMFNINNCIKFKFNKSYEQEFCYYWSKMYGEHKTLNQLIGEPDSEGYYRMQMWEVMKSFGCFFELWKDPIITPDILIDKDDIHDR